MTVGRCTPNLKNSLHEQTSDIKIRLLVGHRKHPFPWAASPKLPSAPILKQIPVLARASPGNQHPSFYSESFRNQFITRGTKYREWLVENITWQLVDSLHRNLANGNCPWLGEASNSNENNVCKILASIPSLALCFQPRSRPFVWLLARTRIRKNTDCFAVYLSRWGCLMSTWLLSTKWLLK